METEFTIPQELRLSYQRLLPYMVNAVRGDIHCQEAILLYLKLGGEKLARIAIDAYNQTYRLEAAKLAKLRLEEALMADQMDDSDEDDEDEDEGDEDDEGKEKSSGKNPPDDDPEY